GAAHGGSGVVSLASLAGGILVDASGSTTGFSTVLAFGGGSNSPNGGASEVALTAFDLVSVNRDRVEASAGEGGSAAITVFFTGRRTGGIFVNGVEGPPFSVESTSPLA